MRILIVTAGYPSVKDTQLGCFMIDQAKALKNAGHDVALIAVKGKPSLETSKKLGLAYGCINGVDCYEFIGIPFGLIKKFFGGKIGSAFERLLYRLITYLLNKKFPKPDLIHAHFLLNLYVGTLLKRNLGIPLVETEHWSELSQPQVDSEIKKLAKETYPKADAIIAVSENLRKRIKEFSGCESIVIHNLLDVSNLSPALEKTNNKNFTIIGLGSLIKRKGFDILIEAFAKSSLKDKNVIIKIFGKGEEKENLQNLIDSKGLSNKIILCGQKPKADIYNELHNADLFVLSSRLENFSVAVIEATANGLPAIATLCGGVEEYPVKEMLKIPVEDVEAMKNALEEMYDKRDSFDRKAIQQQTLDNFAPEVIIRKIEEVYESLLLEEKIS